MPTQQVKLGWRFALSHPAHFIALGAGSGLSPIAPGTAGTIFAWLSFNLINQLVLTICQPSMLSYFIGAGSLLLIASLISWWACKITAKNLNLSDPSAVVCDEIIAFWGLLISLNFAVWWLQILAFIFFRFFDAVKLGLVKWADTNFKGFGWRGAFGILLDDYLAAIMAFIFLLPFLGI